MAGVDQERIDALIATLIAAYQRAGKQIEQELKSIVGEERLYRRRARLKELAAELQVLTAKLDENAKSWVSDELPQIYKLGGGFSATSVGATFSFTKPHQAALNHIAEQTMDDLLKATQHMNADMKRIVRASSKQATLDKLLTGKTAVQAAKDLEGELLKNRVSAIVYRDGSRHGVAEYAEMNLRTVSAIAYNQGLLVEAKKNGVAYVIIYDGIGCGLDSHDSDPKANNMIVPVGAAQAHPISHPNCVPSGTVVEALGETLSGYRSEYVGPLRELVTSKGNRLSITPNHPVFTGRGWLPASAVEKGDHVISRASCNAVTSGANIQNGPAPIQEVFESLRLVGTHSRFIPAASDFHGDALGFKSEVDVINVDCELRDISDALVREKRDQFGFVAAGSRSSVLLAECSTDLLFVGNGPPASSSVGRRGVGFVCRLISDGNPTTTEVFADSQVRDAVIALELESALAGQVFLENEVRNRLQLLARTRSGHPNSIESVGQGFGIDADFRGQISNAFSSKMALDEIVEIRDLDKWHGMVFDLSTELEAYFANDILVHNCVRALSPVIDIKTPEQAQEAMRLGTYATTPDQDAAQLQAQELRRGQQRVAARKRARQRRIAERNSRRAS